MIFCNKISRDNLDSPKVKNLEVKAIFCLCYFTLIQVRLLDEISNYEQQIADKNANENIYLFETI